jgi:TonB family protein
MLVRALLVAAMLAAVGGVRATTPREASRGIAADGRVVTSPYGIPPPWRHDIIHLEKAEYPESLRHNHPVANGFFRLIFDVRSGRVRKVIVEQSSGYPAADANIIVALQHWQLRPKTWREFQVHVSIGYGKDPEASSRSMRHSH